MPVDKVREIMRVAQEPVSLETPSVRRKIATWATLSPDEGSPRSRRSRQPDPVEEQLADAETLTPREEKVLRLRFGLEDGRPRTLEEVGKEFNVTRERIRQIEAKSPASYATPAAAKAARLPGLMP